MIQLLFNFGQSDSRVRVAQFYEYRRDVGNVQGIIVFGLGVFGRNWSINVVVIDR